MTKFLLIRHGDTEAIGKTLAGWTPGWHLNAKGKQQAEVLAGKLAPLPVQAVYTSPLERAIETAEPIARRHGLEPIPLQDVGELRLGEWEGRTFDELEPRHDWQAFNRFRGAVRPPGGELMIECQTRMMRQIACLGLQHTGQTVAVVSHSDPLKALLAYYLSIPLDFLLRFEISPASLSIVRLAEWGASVLAINQTEGLPI